MKYYIVFVILLIAFPSFSQNNLKEMERKKQQMEQDISYTSALINQAETKQRTNIDHLNLVRFNIDKRKSLLKNIDTRLLELSREIETRQRRTALLYDSMSQIKDNYAEMLKIAYRGRNPHLQLMYIAASEDINQAYRRMTYLKRFSDALLQHSHKLSAQNEALTAEINSLKKAKTEQEILMEQKKEEVEELDKEVKNYERIVSVLEKQKTMLMRDLDMKKQQAALLNKQIETAIAEETRREAERQRRERERQERLERERLAAELKNTKGKAVTLPPLPPVMLDSRFEKLKGNLQMPVKQGVIVTRFGINNHPVFPSIQLTSNGIDISTNVGAIVNVVADGIVRKVFTTSTVTSILVQHDVYYTVYTHLTNIKVAAGDMVRAHQPLGLVDISNDRAILHFELWKQTEKQDPELWLARK